MDDPQRRVEHVPPPRKVEFGPSDRWQTAKGCIVAPIYAALASVGFGFAVGLTVAFLSLRFDVLGSRFVEGGVIVATWFVVPGVVFALLIRSALREHRPHLARCVGVAAAVYGTLTLLATAGVRLGYL